MNTGSIQNPTTREARLFAFMQQHIGVRFTANDLDVALNPGGHSPCAHSYLAGLRVQLDACPALGYVLPPSVFDKTKGNQDAALGRVGAYVYWLERRVEVGAQMELVA